MAKNIVGTSESDTREYAQVRRDLTFVIILNLIFFGGLIGLYFFNRSTGQVDQFFAQLLKF